MKAIIPKTLKEALKVIEKQKTGTSKKDSELQKQQEEIIKARVEIERLNEQLAIKRAREFAARSEKSSKMNLNPLIRSVMSNLPYFQYIFSSFFNYQRI